MKKLQPKKIAVFYDWISTWGGAERLLLDILNTYPNADIYTTYYNASKSSWLPPDRKVQVLPKIPIFLEKTNFDKYDLLLAMGTTYNNYFITKPKTLYISIVLSPNRHLEKFPFSLYKPIDKIVAHRPDHLVSISKTIESRIRLRYELDSDLIYPGIDTKKFNLSSRKRQNYYLLVGRLVEHKRIDLAIKACIGLNKKLVIIGNGRLKFFLEKISTKNIVFLGNVDDSTLVKHYQTCKAVISPQLEDFGLVNLEAMACGTPVIAFDSGGNTETVLHKTTGYLFEAQTVDSLKQAIMYFEQIKIHPKKCRQQSLKFSNRNFVLNLKEYIDEKLRP